MTIKDRRERQKKSTRDGILNAALQIARADGWTAVTVRRVADLVEYTPPIIYEYFANKGAMLVELQAQGFILLAEYVRAAGESEVNARARILLVCDAYVRFAYEHPELYQLMHGWGSADVPLGKTLTEATRVGEIVQDCLESWAAAEKFVLTDPEAAVEIAWALLHGLISVEMLGRIGGGRERVNVLARQSAEDLLDAWAAKRR